MASTPFKSVSWSREPITDEKLNQMANNSQWLFENMPKATYSAYGVKKATSIKIMAGIAVVPANNGPHSSITVEFGSYFSAGCKPVVVTGTQPTSWKWRTHVLVRGIGTYYPDHRGVILTGLADNYGTTSKNVIDAKVYVHYIAVGW